MKVVLILLGLMASLQAAYASEWQARAISELKTEPQIVEVLFNGEGSTSLWVSVRDDGSDRDGYASYVCLVLKESGMPAGTFTVIHIWDAHKILRKELVELGRNECS